MHESSEPPRDPLAFQALLYASGELPEAEAAAFERRLGEDQAARDALCLAVQFCPGLHGGAPVTPDRAYRDQVRQRLRTRRVVPRWWLEARPYRGHPALWSLGGAAAAVLLMFALGQLLPGSWRAVEGSFVLPPSDTQPDLPLAPESVETVEVAQAWAELYNATRLAQARNEEIRRKNRAEERRPGKVEDRRGRPLALPVLKD
jgi:hypothetical protein